MSLISTSLRILIVQSKWHLNCPPKYGKKKWCGGCGYKGSYYCLGFWNNVRQLQSDLEDIGSSRQGEAFDCVQINGMSAQIEKHSGTGSVG